MPKISQEVIDSVPGLKAAQMNKDINFINFATEDTTLKRTEGFTDNDIDGMNMEALNAQLINMQKEEENIVKLHSDLITRRNSLMNIIRRKQEI